MIFKCGNQGGMRRSKATNTLILITDATKGLYDDRWDDDTLHYTGMGLSGDQNIDWSQNKTLNRSRKSGIEIFLFEVLQLKSYTFRGQVKLASDPYQDKQLDQNGLLRSVWIFPLKLVNSNLLINHADLMKLQIAKESEAKKIDISELKLIVKNIAQKPSMRTVQSPVYERNPYIAEYAKRRASGFCELCKESAPFIDKNSIPFLEAHHIIWFSRGGSDAIDNVVALCPNCHRKMHILDDEKHKKALSNISTEDRHES